MKKDAYRKLSSDVSHYAATIVDVGNNAPATPDQDKKPFDDFVLRHNDTSRYFKQGRLSRHFYKLTDDDKELIVASMREQLVGCNVFVEAKECQMSDEGKLYVMSPDGHDRQDLSELVEHAVIRLYQNEPLDVEVKLISFADLNHLVVEHQGRRKMVCLNFMGTDVEKLNDEEKYNLTRYMHSLIKHNEVKLSVGGLYDGKWCATLQQDGRDLNKMAIDLITGDFPKKTSDHAMVEFNCLLSKVVDGDTIDVYKGGKRHTIRLAGNDAPELKQEFGVQSTNALKAMLAPDLRIESFYEDDYDRALGYVHCPYKGREICANRQMVRRGWAYAATSHAVSSNVGASRYAGLQKDAQEESLGLWLNGVAPSKRPDVFRDERKQAKLQKQLRRSSIHNK
jgi:endonuclease YncB( thermonuclease family)